MGSVSSSSVIPEEERERLAAVRRYDLLDTPPDGAFDRVAALAARSFAVPIATVTIVDEDRIWFKARYGVDVQEIGRDPGLCASAILSDDVYVVTDALRDPRTLNNPLVRGELRLRFYAAAPIVTRDGYRLGTVNVIDRRPRGVTEEEQEVLRHLAALVADELDLRLVAKRVVELEREKRAEAQHVAKLLQRWLLPSHLPTVPGLEIAARYRPASPELDVGGDFYDVFEVRRGTWALAIGDVCGKGAEAAAIMGMIRRELRTLASLHRRPRFVLEALNETLLHEGLGERFCTVGFLLVRPIESGAIVTASSAGHPLPLVRRAAGEIERVEVPGQPLGIFPEVALTERRLVLGDGDLLVLYTDGVVEQRGLDIGIGEERLRRALASHRDRSAAALASRLEEATARFEAEADDDSAILVAVVRRVRQDGIVRPNRGQP